MSVKSKQFILALDIGTSSVRAALYDHSGKVLPKTTVKNERSLETTEGGGVEIDAELAVDQVVRAIDDVLKAAADTDGDISHVAASSFWHSLVGVDRKGVPTTKVLAWGDTRSSNLIGTLRKRLSEPDLHDRTGARFHSSYWPAKLLWIRTAMPDVWKRTERWLSFSDHLGQKLFGDATTSTSMASGTGLFDIRNCRWDDELARFFKGRYQKASARRCPGRDVASKF